MNRITFFAAIVAGLAIAGCASDKTATDTKVEHLKTEPTSAKVESRDIVGYVLMDGKLYVPPTSEAIIRAPYDSPVEQVMASVGQSVDKGDVLLKMSLPNQQQYYAQAQANVKAAESAYSNAKTTYEAPVREAQRQLDQARSTEKTLRAQAGQSAEGADLQQAIEARQQAEEAVLRAKTDANANLLQYKQQLDTARTTFQLATSGARQANVTAPISGTLLSLSAQSGKQLVGGTQIGQIVDLGDLLVKTDLTPAQAGVVDENKAVVITFVGLEDKHFDGEIKSVRTLPVDTKSVKREATIGFKNDSGLVKPGMQVKSVGVKVGEAHDVLAVPATAVFTDKTGKTSVRVMTDGQWVVRVIEPGLSDGFFTQIKSGLEKGDTVRVPGAL